jgi:hypothetical protein
MHWVRRTHSKEKRKHVEYTQKDFISLSTADLIVREVIFYAGKTHYRRFQGVFRRGQDFFKPRNCPERRKFSSITKEKGFTERNIRLEKIEPFS